MKTYFLTLIAAASLLAGTSAIASTHCKQVPQANRVTQESVLRKLADEGYTIERFELSDGGCYKMRGWSKEGQRVKIAHDPADGSVVKMKVQSRSAS